MARIGPTGPFCPPHTPGELWLPEHGAAIRTELACDRIYDADGVYFARWCERHGIPTGVPLPRDIREAAERTYRYAPYHGFTLDLAELQRQADQDHADRQRMIADIHAMLAEAAARVAAAKQPMLLAAE